MAKLRGCVFFVCFFWLKKVIFWDFLIYFWIFVIFNDFLILGCFIDFLDVFWIFLDFMDIVGFFGFKEDFFFWIFGFV